MARKFDAWMPLYIGAYHADTTHLTRSQHGAYLLLLMAYWRKGGALPADDTRLAAIAKATPKEWRRLRPVMADFFEIRDGHWHQKRADRELTRAAALMEARSIGGQRTAQARRKIPDSNENNDLKTAEQAFRHALSGRPLPSQEPEQEQTDSDSVLEESLGGKKEDGFADFFAAFPRRVAQRAAEIAYSAARERASAQTLFAGAQRYAASVTGTDPRYIAHAATWLDADRWLDEAAPDAASAAVPVNWDAFNNPEELENQRRLAASTNDGRGGASAQSQHNDKEDA